MSELDKMNESLKKVGETFSRASMQAEISSLKKELKDKQCKIEEMQHYIDCLTADLVKAKDNKILLPHEPIKVAEMLIDATETRENCMTGKEYYKPVFDKWQLEQIARHLLVYCGKCEE